MNPERPKVGVGVIITRNGKILIGRRVGNHGSGTYMIPGGHLEFGETFEQAARREATEECGLTDLVFKGVVSIGNDIAYGKHYISIGLLAESLSGEPTTPEPDKADDWQWYDLNALPDTIYIPSKKAIENWKNGIMCSDQ